MLTFPLENNMSKTPGSFNKNQPEIFKIHQHIAVEVLANRVAKDNDPFVLTTEHDLNQRQKIIVTVNYDDKISVAPIELKEGWAVEKSFYGEFPVNLQIKIKPNDAAVYLISRK